MVVPVIWYFFLSNLDTEVSRAGSYEAAIVQLSEGVSPIEREELLAFFREAIHASEEDCRTITAEGVDFPLYFEPAQGSCKEVYIEILSLFDPATNTDN